MSIACSASYPTAPTGPAPIAALKVHFDLPQNFLLPGTTQDYIAYAVDADEVYTNVTSRATWLSSDLEVVVPGASGTFRAQAPGDARISAVYQGFSDSATASVRRERPPFLENYLWITYLPTVNVRQTVTTSAYLSQSFRSRDVTTLATWTSSNPNVATAQQGRITGVAPGTVEIIASYEGFSDSYRFSVPPILLLFPKP